MQHSSSGGRRAGDLQIAGEAGRSGEFKCGFPDLTLLPATVITAKPRYRYLTPPALPACSTLPCIITKVRSKDTRHIPQHDFMW